jgi:hypothetical protein
VSRTVYRFGHDGTPAEAERIVAAFRETGVSASRVSGWTSRPCAATAALPVEQTRRGWLTRPGAGVTWRVEGERAVVTVVSEAELAGLALEAVEGVTTSDGPVLSWIDAVDGAPHARERRYLRGDELVALRVMAVGEDGQEIG